MGVTVEGRQAKPRVSDLLEVQASTRFLSCEPLLESLGDLPLDGVDWVIVGGESDPGARPMLQEWVEEILAECRRQQVAFFFKQRGGPRKKRAGRMLHGRTYDEYPRCHTRAGADMPRRILPIAPQIQP